MINSDEKLFVYCRLFGQVLKENGKERLKVFIVYKDNISLREKEIWILLESLFLRLNFFPSGAMLEFEKLNLSGATNVMSQVVKTILICAMNVFCFIIKVS